MALRPQRNTVSVDVSFFTDSEMERGGVVAIKTGGSGASMDNGNAVVEYVANPSGKCPVGVLLNDIKDEDLSRHHLNSYRDELPVGGKCTIMTRGTVTTNKVYPGVTPAAGDIAYLHYSGYIGNQSVATSRQIGVFLSSKDEEGFVKVEVNI